MDAGEEPVSGDQPEASLLGDTDVEALTGAAVADLEAELDGANSGEVNADEASVVERSSSDEAMDSASQGAVQTDENSGPVGNISTDGSDIEQDV